MIPQLAYDDGTDRFEYVVFSDSARRHSIPQYFDNREVYGLLTLNDDLPALISRQLETIKRALGQTRSI